MTMRDVLFVGRWFPPLVGGVENYLFELYRRLPPGRADLLLPAEAGAAAFDQAHPELRVIRVRLPAGVSSAGKRALGPLLGAALRRLVRPGYRQVHCGHILTGVAGYLAQRIWGRPYIVFTYGAELTREGLGGLKRLVLRNATAVVTISRYTTEQALRLGVRSGRVVVIPPGVDSARYHPDLDGTAIRARHHLGERPVLVTVGRLAPTARYKGLDTVIQALPAIRRQVGDVAYLIAGTGPDQPWLEALAAEVGVSAHVIFAGYVPDADLPGYFAAGDVFVLPNRVDPPGTSAATEGFGMVFIEAAACGLPVIAGNHGGARDAVVHEQTGLLLDVPDAAHVAEAAVCLLTDRALARRLGAQGRARVLRAFSWDRSAARLEKLITLLDQRHSTRI
jgi:phosphatidylinositol alpha-1,6-mannosyltransferase